MSFSVNKVILIGHLGKDPETKEGQSGAKVCTFSVATSDSYKNKAGEWVNNTEWHKIVILNAGLITMAGKTLKKGSKVYLEGSIRTKKWTNKDGVEKVSTEVVLMPYKSELICLDERPKSEGAEAYGTTTTRATQSDTYEDDEIPF